MTSASRISTTALDGTTKAIPRGVAGATPIASPVRTWAGDLVAVTGARGSGAAHGRGRGRGRASRPLVVREPCCSPISLDADQGVLHHAPDIVPGLPELVEAHRSGSLGPSAVHSMVFDVEERGYHLLLGMRRRRGWSALRPRALDAALDSLLAAYPIVVGDVDPDIDGHHECGSFEVEDRNAISRTVLTRASATVVVGTATTGGLHSLAQVLRDVLEHGVDPLRLVPVVNHAPRSPRERAAIARALPQLTMSGSAGSRVAAPLFVTTRRAVEDAVRAGRPLPSPLVTPMTRAVSTVLETRGLTLRGARRRASGAHRSRKPWVVGPSPRPTQYDHHVRRRARSVTSPRDRAPRPRTRQAHRSARPERRHIASHARGRGRSLERRLPARHPSDGNRRPRASSTACCETSAVYGPSAPLLVDDDVWEIEINAPDAIFVKRHAGPSGFHDEVFHDDDHVLRTLTRLLDDAPGAHRKLDPAEGLQDARLDDGSRGWTSSTVTSAAAGTCSSTSASSRACLSDRSMSSSSSAPSNRQSLGSSPRA